MLENTSLRFPKTQFQRMLVLKYSAIVLVGTFLALQLLVVDNLDGWPEDTERDVAKYILPDENTTLIFPEVLKKSPNRKLDVLLIVSSDPRRSDRRDSIRRTWGLDQSTGLKTGLVFLVGLTSDAAVDIRVTEESSQHGDVLLERFHESYLNLTVKSMMLVKFAATYDLNADFVFKVGNHFLTTGTSTHHLLVYRCQNRKDYHIQLWKAL